MAVYQRHFTYKMGYIRLRRRLRRQDWLRPWIARRPQLGDYHNLMAVLERESHGLPTNGACHVSQTRTKTYIWSYQFLIIAYFFTLHSDWPNKRLIGGDRRALGWRLLLPFGFWQLETVIVAWHTTQYQYLYVKSVKPSSKSMVMK